MLNTLLRYILITISFLDQMSEAYFQPFYTLISFTLRETGMLTIIFCHTYLMSIHNTHINYNEFVFEYSYLFTSLNIIILLMDYL